MSTHGTIGYKGNDGKYYYVYNHYDSYPEGLGQELLYNLTEEDEIISFINEGDRIYFGEAFQDGDGPLVCDDENEMKKEEFTYLYENGAWFIAHYDEEFERLDSLLI